MLAIFLFLPGWSLNYWQAWVFLAVFSISVSLITLYFLKKMSLIQSCSKVGAAEREKRLKNHTDTRWYLFHIAFHHFEYRPSFGSKIPLILFSSEIFWCARALYCFSCFQRKYVTSATIEVTEEQKVISTGPYASDSSSDVFWCIYHAIGNSARTRFLVGTDFFFLLFAAIVWRLLEEENSFRRNCQDIQVIVKKSITG